MEMNNQEEFPQSNLDRVINTKKKLSFKDEMLESKAFSAYSKY